MKITPEKIQKAAEDLRAQGKNPTIEGVRKALGGGSYSYIGPALKEWREKQNEITQASTMDLPDELLQAHKQAVAVAWKAASDLATQKIKHAEELANKKVKDAETDRNELISEISNLEKKIATEEEAKNEAEEELKQAVNDSNILRNEISEAKATIKQQTERLKKAARWMELAKEQQQLNKQLQDERAALTQKIGELTGELKAVQGKSVQKTTEC